MLFKLWITFNWKKTYIHNQKQFFKMKKILLIAAFAAGVLTASAQDALRAT